MASWKDSTYQKQLSYYKKLAADYAAQEIRRKAELAQYYGTLGTPRQTEEYETWVPSMVRDYEWVNGKRELDWDYGKKKVTRERVTQKGTDPTEGLYQQELRAERERDVEDILNDYASRGILRSGLYAKKRSNYETEFGKQLAEINRQRSKKYADLAAEKTAFQREQELQKENARLDAIRRRAAKTGNWNF